MNVQVERPHFVSSLFMAGSFLCLIGRANKLNNEETCLWYCLSESTREARNKGGNTSPSSELGHVAPTWTDIYRTNDGKGERKISPASVSGGVISACTAQSGPRHLVIHSMNLRFADRTIQIPISYR